jgi:hypothetical protein
MNIVGGGNMEITYEFIQRIDVMDVMEIHWVKDT